jgi:hypothetical protein
VKDAQNIDLIILPEEVCDPVVTEEENSYGTLATFVSIAHLRKLQQFFRPLTNALNNLLGCISVVRSNVVMDIPEATARPQPSSSTLP